MNHYNPNPLVQSRQRSAFTLIELLVVLAILSILVALTAATAMGVLGYQRSSNTETALRTLDSALDKQWQAVVKKASTETISGTTWNNLLNLAGGGTAANNVEKRARVIWIKLRLKQEFPMNISEVLNGPLAVSSGSISPLSGSELSAKPTYTAFFNAQNPKINSAAACTNNPYVWPTESSLTLLMSLEIGRTGIAFGEDMLPPAALKPTVLQSSFTPATPAQLTGLPYLVGGVKQVVDAWGSPLVFYRWPCPQPSGSLPDDSEVDASGPSSSALARDPQDPEGVLMDPTWNSSSSALVPVFERLLHPIHTFNGATYTPISYFMRPVIVSAGKDGFLGLRQPTVNQSPLAPDNMNVDQSNANRYDQDNIYSYRLRQGARGDG
jgi:prepilin-type N-terminal cleavage/methylation domain-containing protein